MRRLSYQESKQVDYRRLYVFLEELMQGCENQHILKEFYVCDHLERLQVNILASRNLADHLFKKLKKCCDQADNYIELEKYIVYMDWLFDDSDEPFIHYKRNLLKVILDYTTDYFTSDEYCVIRHLCDKRMQVEDRIALGKHNVCIHNFLTDYFDCEIFLIEGHYQKAMQLLQKIPMEGILLDYQDELEDYCKKENHKKWLLSLLPKRTLSIHQNYGLIR